MWHGDWAFLTRHLIMKDFRIRYRNMSLGFLWSVLNPLVMMSVLTFIFTQIFPNPTLKNYSVFVLCGLVPFNFFTIAWVTGTTSVVDNAALLKRNSVPREIIPITAVLSNVLHLAIQFLLLTVISVVFGVLPNLHWLWMPLIWALEILFVCGLCFITSALNVYVRDTRYVVESVNTVMFWLVPVIYPFSMIPQKFAELYQYNPVAALVLAMRQIVLENQAPSAVLITKLLLVSLTTAVFGYLFFRRAKARFYNYL